MTEYKLCTGVGRSCKKMLPAKSFNGRNNCISCQRKINAKVQAGRAKARKERARLQRAGRTDSLSTVKRL